jgi:hypothetical protein
MSSGNQTGAANNPSNQPAADANPALSCSDGTPKNPSVQSSADQNLSSKNSTSGSLIEDTGPKMSGKGTLPNIAKMNRVDILSRTIPEALAGCVRTSVTKLSEMANTTTTGLIDMWHTC